FYTVAQVARQDQYGRANQAAYCLASLLAGLLALAVCYRITRSPVAVFAACLATPFVFYLVAAPSYSHTFSALAVSLFVWAWRGLFVWHPVTLAAVAGFIWVKGWRLRVAMAFSLLFETAINGAVGDWWGGLAFGQRRFLDLLPYFAIGLTALAERLRPALAWAAAGLLTAWNFVLWANFAYVIHTDTDPGLKLVTGQVRALLYVPRLFGQGYVLRHADLLLLALEAACLAVAFNLAHGHGEQASPQRDDARLQRGADP